MEFINPEFEAQLRAEVREIISDEAQKTRREVTTEGALLTRAKAAKFAGVSVQVIDSFIEAGLKKSYPTSSQTYFILKSDLINFIKAHQI